MEAQLAQFVNRGMNQDTSISKSSNEFAYKNYNIRITAINDNTALSVTNEKGTTEIMLSTSYLLVNNKITLNKDNINTPGITCKLEFQYTAASDVSIKVVNNLNEEKVIIVKKGMKEYPFIDDIIAFTILTTIDYKYNYHNQDSTPLIEIKELLQGEYLGHTILNNNIVLFTKGEEFDYIYKVVDNNGKFKVSILYKGNLNFSNPIEALPYYETEDIQKVYWVDGINPTRVINIVGKDILDRPNTQFDFNPEILKYPKVSITKEYKGLGVFPSGTIQYFITYYNKFGAETAIVYSSSLNYLNHKDRGASPEEFVTCSFKLNITNLDTSYDYIRVYSAKRTSLNSDIQLNIVGDYPISDKLSVIDTNTNQASIDPKMLFFLGGDKFIASTITQKDDTLFLGNIEIPEVVLDSKVKQAIEKTINNNTSSIVQFAGKTVSYNKAEGYYPYTPQTNNNSLSFKGFKKGETYRFAIQFQTKDGKWTTPEWIGDKIPKNSPSIYNESITFTTAKVINTDLASIVDLVKDKYSKYRILMAQTDYLNRKVLAQGIVCPTMFNYKQRYDNQPYAISSWFMRPRNSQMKWQHLDNTGINTSDISEIQMLDTIKPPFYTPEEHINKKAYVVSIVYNGVPNISVATTDADSDKLSEDNVYITQEYPGYGNLYDIASLEYQLTYVFNLLDLKLSDCKISRDNLNEIINNADITNNASLIHGIAYTDKFESIKTVKNSYYLYIQMKDDNNKVLLDASSKKSNYYIDSSILTFHSPELELNQDLIDNNDLKFRIVGIAPITSSYSNADIQVKSKGLSDNSGVVINIENYPNLSANNKTLITGDFYKDNAWVKSSEDGNYYPSNIETTTYYKVHAWNKQGSLNYQSKDSYNKDKDKYTNILAELDKKTYATQLFSYETIYIPDWESVISKPVIFNSDQLEVKKLNIWNKDIYYQGNYDNLLTTVEGYNVTTNNIQIKQYDPIRIKYKSTPHAVFGLVNANNKPQILPRIQGESAFNISELYDSTNNNISYIWEESSQNLYTEDILTDVKDKYNLYPYVYIAELYRDIPEDVLYGGTTEEALEILQWVPISEPTNITDDIEECEGDTYFQRWDCLKTYPFTEEDQNSIVDITSVMIESHINLDGRYDKNRGISNLLNARPTNFNLINDVYSQENNIFTYSILDEKYKQTKYSNQIAFSLQKQPNSDIDTWTNINLSSVFNLNGSYGKLNKIINYNDSLITFQDKSISVINFNNRTALSTESGIPIEIANSGKVQGFNTMSNSLGCNNKEAMCVCSNGVYFIDYNTNSLYRFNNEGINNLSINGFSQWFKHNLTGNEKLLYDSITMDLYIVNKNECLVYNEILQSFTSFMDYQNTQTLFNLNNGSYSIYNNKMYKLFDGEYNNIYNKPVGYSIEYRINPEPLVDKVFTNIEFLADSFIDNTLLEDCPFNTLEVWNEYQSGITYADSNKYPNIKKKFRVWRGDIPRDAQHPLNRIRNPWIHLKLSKTELDNYKTIFHSLIVKYYK